MLLINLKRNRPGCRQQLGSGRGLYATFVCVIDPLTGNPYFTAFESTIGVVRHDRSFLRPHCRCSCICACTLSAGACSVMACRQCSVTQPRRHTLLAACGRCSDDDERCVRRCQSAGDMVDSSAQHGALCTCSCICGKCGHLRWGSDRKCVVVD